MPGARQARCRWFTVIHVLTNRTLLACPLYAAAGIRTVSKAIKTKGGASAVSLRVAEQYVPSRVSVLVSALPC